METPVSQHLLKKIQVYVISDGVPISRREICAAAVKSKHFAGKELPTFEAQMMVPPADRG